MNTDQKAQREIASITLLPLDSAFLPQSVLVLSAPDYGEAVLAFLGIITRMIFPSNLL
jgi:hypothetical protein